MIEHEVCPNQDSTNRSGKHNYHYGQVPGFLKGRPRHLIA